MYWGQEAMICNNNCWARDRCFPWYEIGMLTPWILLWRTCLCLDTPFSWACSSLRLLRNLDFIRYIIGPMEVLLARIECFYRCTFYSPFWSTTIHYDYGTCFSMELNLLFADASYLVIIYFGLRFPNLIERCLAIYGFIQRQKVALDSWDFYIQNPTNIDERKSKEVWCSCQHLVYLGNS